MTENTEFRGCSRSLLSGFVILCLQVRELLSQKLSSWQQSCSQPTKLPERALNLLRHTAPQSSGTTGMAEVLRHPRIGSEQVGHFAIFFFFTFGQKKKCHRFTHHNV